MEVGTTAEPAQVCGDEASVDPMKQGDDGCPHDILYGWRSPNTDGRGILTEAGITDVVQAILNLPMPATLGKQAVYRWKQK